MPIPLPNLDDRRWSDLVDDGRAQVPRYAPAWTDHNLHDPGITLIELFAWLAEMTDYTLDRVPARHKLKFLALLGYVPNPPLPAHTLLSFTPAPLTAPFILPAGAEFEGTNADGQVIPFRTLQGLTISPVTLRAVQVDAGGGTFIDRTRDFADGLPFDALGPDPGLESALYLGFDPIGVDVPVALGFRFAGPGNDAAERARIIEEAIEQSVACQPVRTRFQCQPPPAPAVAVLPPHHSAVIVWETYTAAGWVPLDALDDTRSLTLDGIVEITLPAAIVTHAFGVVADSFFYIRGRLDSGALDAAPKLIDIELNAVPAAQSVPATETFLIKSGIAVGGTAPTPGSSSTLTFTVDERKVIQTLDFGGGGPAAIVWAYTAPGAGTGQITLDLQLIGTGTGLPGQAASLPQAPAVRDSVELYTLLAGVWLQWIRRAGFDASSRVDPDFVLDSSTGAVAFGNGERGLAPEAGCLIFARYLATAAAAGNVPPGTVARTRTSPVNDILLSAIPPAAFDQLDSISTNRGPAVDGSDAEALNHAIGRAVEVLHAHERLLDLATELHTDSLDQIDRARVRALTAPRRGVNLLDLERIALAVPGTRVDRSRAWASLHPSYPCLEAPGVVTIIVVPELPLTAPSPSQGLLDAVWRYLNRRRMVCTTLQVTGPQYVEVTVTATVAVRAGASPAKVQERILTALATFLHPLSGGPDALGWPFGRNVFRSEIFQLIEAVPGLDHVNTLSMQADTGPSQCGDIALCPLALVRSGPHRIEVS